MVLSASHKVALRQMGYTARDVAEIGLAFDAGEFTYKGENGRRISEGAAKTKLGMYAFLSGIGRAAFHRTAVRGEEGASIMIVRK